MHRNNHQHRQLHLKEDKALHYLNIMLVLAVVIILLNVVLTVNDMSPFELLR